MESRHRPRLLRSWRPFRRGEGNVTTASSSTSAVPAAKSAYDTIRSVRPTASSNTVYAVNLECGKPEMRQAPSLTSERLVDASGTAV